MRFNTFNYKVSKNNTKTCWVLKCDIRKFFASINHEILKNILSQYILDKNVLWLLSEIINSFQTSRNLERVVPSDNCEGLTLPAGQAGFAGLPLGNLTSQLFVNIYMNEFDQFVKHKLKAKYYIRYADDFVLLFENRDWLEKQKVLIQDFLKDNLKLNLHPDKVFIKTVASGIDFLGWINFTDHRVLRTATKKRMFRNLKNKQGKKETIQSCLGILGWGNAVKLKEKVWCFLQ